MVGLLPSHGQQFDVEDQGLIRQRAAVAIGKRGRDDQLNLAALLDEWEPFRPSLDDAI